MIKYVLIERHTPKSNWTARAALYAIRLSALEAGRDATEYKHKTGYPEYQCAVAEVELPE